MTDLRTPLAAHKFPTDLQTLFNVTYVGLAKQGWQRSTHAGSTTCLYRGAKGRRCAMGFHIPDELYTLNMEGLGARSTEFKEWYDVVENTEDNIGDRWILTPVGQAQRELMAEMQRMHDNSQTPEEMERAFRYIAINHDFNIPAITE